MHSMLKILILYLLLTCVKSLFYNQIKRQSISKDMVIYFEENIPSNLACVHKCIYLKTEALYVDSTCYCIKKKMTTQGANGEIVTGLYMTPTKRNLCYFRVLSIESKNSERNNGYYFHFDRSEFRLQFNKELKFKGKNLRSGRVGKIRVWGYNWGGSVGDGVGRYDRQRANGDWVVGDHIIVLDKFLGECIYRPMGY